MTRKILLAAAVAMLSAPVGFAQEIETTGDAAAGEAAFRQCIACHVVVNDDGETLAGRNARVGPNLYGVAGRTAGMIEDFRYSPGFQAINEAEMVWNEDLFVEYVQDPTGFLRDQTGNNSYRGSMTFRVRSAEQAADIYAYLASLQAE